MASNCKQQATKLSKNDERTLHSIFNPNLPYGDVLDEDIEQEAEGNLKLFKWF